MSIFGLEQVKAGPLPDGRGVTKHRFVEWEAHIPADTHGQEKVVRLVTPFATLPPQDFAWGGIQFSRSSCNPVTKQVWYWRERK